MLESNLTTKTENKPANVEEAINAGWKTAEEMYTTANSSRRTWDNFVADVKNATSEKPNSRCATDCIANLVVKLGSSHKAYYHPKVEKAFQLYLMKNQSNQGRSSQVVKQATTENLELGALAHVALTNREAWEQFKALGDAKLETEEKLKLEHQQNQQLQLENQSMRNTLQYDKVKGWYKWSDLKRDWKPHCDMLKKSNYETIFYEAGLEYGKDYEEITFSGYEFPTCMVSPTALPKLISYLHIF